METLKQKLSIAIQSFWQTRENQFALQGRMSGRRDYGNRGAVTGGAQLNGFVSLVKDILISCHLPPSNIHVKDTTIPGYFRPVKKWDLVVVIDNTLLASIEFKSHIGPSFGNNFNNRVEEALGNATDLWKAYEIGLFKPSSRPWLGYLMLLEEHPNSLKPLNIKQPHFNVLPEFFDASYVKRYELFCERLVRERLYDAACFILSNEKDGLDGKFIETSEELSFENFVTSLSGHAIAFAKKMGYY